MWMSHRSYELLPYGLRVEINKFGHSGIIRYWYGTESFKTVLERQQTVLTRWRVRARCALAEVMSTRRVFFENFKIPAPS